MTSWVSGHKDTLLEEFTSGTAEHQARLGILMRLA